MWGRQALVPIKTQIAFPVNGGAQRNRKRKCLLLSLLIQVGETTDTSKPGSLPQFQCKVDSVMYHVIGGLGSSVPLTRLQNYRLEMPTPIVRTTKKLRRLYDIPNVLSSVNLIEKDTMGKPTFTPSSDLDASRKEFLELISQASVSREAEPMKMLPRGG
ncbi:unnamed protein product [Eruca vesicaria subsp. sativa]|uniref:E2F/DP family winged-helix DNA-binding domain-containing protein n=1 Tax=Eruca vesicaria subsp. sativa TaxID=29727 RepID=A0ABC8L1J4_ERUVS|nr:unnamed protein product [Eruca vesicaria subsp. sativa]